MTEEPPGDIYEGLWDELSQVAEGDNVPFKTTGERWEFGLYFDRNGQPINLPIHEAAWVVELARQNDPSCFMKAHFSWHGIMLTVHTSYLGLNHQFLSGPPLVWETMTEGDLTGWGDFCYRYATEKAAKIGHEKVVAHLVALGLELVDAQ